MNIFTIYNGTCDYGDSKASFRKRTAASSSAAKRYNQLMQMLNCYVATSSPTEKVVHVYNNDTTGYTLMNDHFMDLTSKNMTSYLMENDGQLNHDDFLFHSLLDIVPEQIILHCDINSNLYTTLTQIFSDVRPWA